jgi:hypothetical protein
VRLDGAHARRGPQLGVREERDARPGLARDVKEAAELRSTVPELTRQCTDADSGADGVQCVEGGEGAHDDAPLEATEAIFIPLAKTLLPISRASLPRSGFGARDVFARIARLGAEQWWPRGD